MKRIWNKIKCWLMYRKCWWYKYLIEEQRLFKRKVKK